jgi:hypothetical protein
MLSATSDTAAHEAPTRNAACHHAWGYHTGTCHHPGPREPPTDAAPDEDDHHSLTATEPFEADPGDNNQAATADSLESVASPMQDEPAERGDFSPMGRSSRSRRRTGAVMPAIVGLLGHLAPAEGTLSTLPSWHEPPLVRNITAVRHNHLQHALHGNPPKTISHSSASPILGALLRGARPRAPRAACPPCRATGGCSIRHTAC